MFSVTKNGKPLSKDLYTWDEETKTFSTKESWLVLDFSEYDGVTFKTGSHCTFKTGNCCCFNTGWKCTFDTGWGCTFNTGPDCTFNTGSYCTFNTGPDCTFDTGPGCTFNTGPGCTFKTGPDCVIVRRDVFEIIQPEPGVKIKLNEYQVKGYKVVPEVHKIEIDGKVVELSEESYQALANHFKED